MTYQDRVSSLVYRGGKIVIDISTNFTGFSGQAGEKKEKVCLVQGSQEDVDLT